jgi:hypothetical protein
VILRETMSPAKSESLRESSSEEYAPKKEAIKRKASAQSMRARIPRKKQHVESKEGSSSDQLVFQPVPMPKIVPGPRRKSRRLNEEPVPTSAPMPTPSPVKRLPFLSSFVSSPGTSGTASPLGKSVLNTTPLAQRSLSHAVQISTLEDTVRKLNKRAEILEEENKGHLARIERLQGEMDQVWMILAATGQATVEADDADSNGGHIVDNDDVATEAASNASQRQLTRQSSWRPSWL